MRERIGPVLALRVERAPLPLHLPQRRTVNALLLAGDDNSALRDAKFPPLLDEILAQARPRSCSVGFACHG